MTGCCPADGVNAVFVDDINDDVTFVTFFCNLFAKLRGLFKYPGVVVTGADDDDPDAGVVVTCGDPDDDDPDADVPDVGAEGVGVNAFFADDINEVANDDAAFFALFAELRDIL
jgi:hypothetical protein